MSMLCTDPDFRLTGIHSEKDKNSIITTCNTSFLHYAGVKSADQILGRSDYDFPWCDYADIYRQHELDALIANHYSTIIPLKDCKGNDLLFMHTKIQKLDENNNITGVKCHAVEIINPIAKNLVHLLNNKYFKSPCFFLNKNNNIVKLSNKQKEIMFYLTRGKSAKIIAKIMGISNRTVESYICKIKLKVGCTSKNELIDFGIKNGFINMVPQETNLNEIIQALLT